MFIYEKDGKLNIMFQATQIPVEGTPDVSLYKEGDTVHVMVSGKEIAAAETQSDAPVQKAPKASKVTE